MATHGLIGREREVTELRKIAAAARRRRGRLVLIAGEAGIGKTALVEQVLGRPGRVVLRGAAAASGTPPLGPLVQAIRSHPKWPRIADEALIDVAGGSQRTVLLGPMFPEIEPWDGVRVQPERGSTSIAAHERDGPVLRDAICELVVALSRSEGITIVLDDLQYADHATIDALPALARWARRERLLVIGIYRNDELSRANPVRRLRVDLRREGDLDEITLAPLGADATIELAARVLGARPDAVLADRIVDRSQGLPMFVEELAGALLGEGAVSIVDGLATLVRADLPIPETLRDSILVRADGMAPAQREALLIAAVAGDEVETALVDQVVLAANGWAEAGLERGILIADAHGALTFRHALVREVMGDEVPAHERRACHRHIATLLAARNAQPLTVAEHWLAAGEPNEAVPCLVTAAESSSRVRAYRDAATAFRRALDEDRGALVARVEVVERLADSTELSGAVADAARLWEVAAASRAAESRPDLAGQDLRRRARALEVAGRWSRAIEARLAAAHAFESAALPAESAIERLTAASHLRSSANFSASLEVLAVTRALAVESGRRDLEARALGLEGNVRARMGDATEGLALVRRGLGVALDLGLTTAAAELYQRLADSLEHAGTYEPARAAYLEGAEYCRTRSIEPTAQLCLACMAVVLWQTGDWSGAERTSREVIASSDATPHAIAVAEGIAGMVAAMRGNSRRARPHLQRSQQIARRIELAAMELISCWGLAVCDRLDGDGPAALDRYREILLRWERTEERHYVVQPLRWATTVFADAGDAPQVRACTDALATIAAQTGQPEAVAALGNALAEAATLEGDHVAAVAHLTSALETISARDLPLDRAAIGRRMGLALARAGRRADAVSVLVGAARTARRLGATPLSMLIAADLAAMGESVERRIGRREARRLADHGLTSRELEVVRLVSHGLTSREIGTVLFISPRTVDMHVGSALTKLDCRTRAEAVQRVATLGLLSAPSG
jgi:DNA-binding CsgD family transcriptional regulator